MLSISTKLTPPSSEKSSCDSISIRAVLKSSAILLTLPARPPSLKSFRAFNCSKLSASTVTIIDSASSIDIFLFK